MPTLVCGDMLKVLESYSKIFNCCIADPPDNIDLGYGVYKDKMPDAEYLRLMHDWLWMCIQKSDTTWWSFNAKWTIQMGQIAGSILDRVNAGQNPHLEVKPCVQTFTFGQHNQHDLGNNHRPLWRFKWEGAPLYPDQVRVPSWRQLNGDKRADPRGRVPGDVANYEQYTRSTSPLPILTPDAIERFLSKISKGSKNVCWEWLAGKRGGYGRFRIGTHLYVATRLMWRLVHGSDPVGQLILHQCDNPYCCNPDHLFLGSGADNNLDKESKQRGKHPRGEQNGLAKLREDDVLRIFQSVESNKDLAAKYKVTDVAIHAIRTGRTWQHVTNKLLTTDVFNSPRVTGNSKQRRSWHPTQLHEDLVERAIKLTTEEGALVLDPFGGTGTALRVCNRINRDCTLIEIDPAYCDHIATENNICAVWV